MDLTIIAALATIVVAILAPLLTAIIQGKNALKLRTLDIVYSDKMSAYKEFVAAYADIAIAGSSVGQYRRLVAAIGQARLYASNEFDQSAQELSSMLVGIDRGEGCRSR